jgi:hypothetical protein
MNQHLIKRTERVKNLTTTKSTSNILLKSIWLIVLFFSVTSVRSATFYTRGAGGNWGTLATWSTVGCNGAVATTIPGINDDVIICNSNGVSTVTVTVNGNYACNNLTIGTGAANATVTTSNVTYVLTVGGALSFNTGNGAGIYTLAVSSGTCSVAGAVNWNTVSGTNKFTVTTGTLTLSQSVTIANTNQQIVFTGAGKLYFDGDFTTAQNSMTTYTGCRVYFAGNYTTGTTASTWLVGSYAIFTGTGKSIIAGSNITFGYVTIDAAATVTTVADAGTIIIGADLNLAANAAFTINKALTVSYSVILAASSTLTLNDNIAIGRNWTNNGGTLIGNSNTVTFKGYLYTIGGTTGTDFPNIVIGLPGGTTRVAYTQNTNITCTGFIMETNSYANSSSYTLGTTNPTLTVNGDLTIKQLTTAKANSLYVNGGALNVLGNLAFSGTVNTAAQVTQVVVTSGSFNLSGNITWMEQTGTALVATEVISVTTGTLTFAKSVSLPKGSGTIKVTGTGTINFNGTTAPSMNSNGAGVGTTNAVFTAAAGSTINFAAGFTNGNTLTFTAGSYQNFTGTGTITPTGAIRFGHLNIGSGATITLAGAIALQNTWVDNGTFVPSTYTVTFNGSSATTQSITKTGGETFYGLTLATASATLTLYNDVQVTYSLAMSGHNINLNGYTLQLGNGAASTLSRSAGAAYGGTFKRYWLASTAVSSSANGLYGLFPIGAGTSYRPVAITSTVSPTGAGYVTATHNNSSAVTEVSYTEGGVAIQRVSNQSAVLATSGVTGGTYTINVTYSGFNSAGAVSDLRLQINTGGVNTAVGTHTTTTGTPATPTLKRTGLTLAQLSNSFVAGTKAKIATPIVAYYYSRGATGNWSSTTAWSTIAGGAGASCSCVPPAASYVMICAGQTMTLDIAETVEFITIENGATLDGTANLTVNNELYLNGTGKIAPTAGTWSLDEVFITGTTASTSSAALSIVGALSIPVGASLTMNAALTLNNNLTVNGTLNTGSATTMLNGTSGKTISGTGTISGSGTLSITTADKSILSGTALTIEPVVSLANGITLTNNGTVTLSGNLTGGNNSSTWVNAAGSVLNTAGTVLSTGTLTASAVSNTVNYNGSGAQTIKATTYDNLMCSNAGTKTAAANFAVNDLLTITDAAIVDESTYVISGTADLSMNGTSELKLQRTGNGTYPELTGTYLLTGGTVTINQSSNNTATLQAADYYNLKLNGSRPYDMSDVTTINNNLYVETSATLINSVNLTVEGILSYTGSGATTLAGNLQAGGIVLTNGILNDGGNTITITDSAGWTKTGGTFISTGDVVFQGSVAQSINGESATTFNNLTIDNSSGTGVTLNQPVTIAGYLNLTTGYLYSSPTNTLTIADGAASSQGSSASFVDGPMTKIGNDAFTFPVGDYGTLGRVSITAPASAGTHFTAEYVRSAYGNDQALTAPLKKVSTLEHWLLERTGSSDAVGIRLYWGNASGSGITDCNDLRIAHWNGSSWVKEAAVVSGSCSGSGSIATISGLTSFSPFTFGSEKEQMANNPLPIELINFEAKADNDNVALSWTTATEINNDYFTIEKSNNGITFSNVMEVTGAGNSNTILHYDAIDAIPYSGYSYYRLKQTDFDGQFTYSNLVAVNFKGEATDVISLYPNPKSAENLKIKLLAGFENGIMEVSVYDLQGLKLFTDAVDITQLQANGYYELNHHFANGTYIVEAKVGSIETRKKLIVID